MREIQAAEAEVASTERRRGEHEDQLLEVMERAEAVAAELAALGAARTDLAAELVAAGAARDAAAGELTDRIAAEKLPVTEPFQPDAVAKLRERRKIGLTEAQEEVERISEILRKTKN